MHSNFSDPTNTNYQTIMANTSPTKTPPKHLLNPSCWVSGLVPCISLLVLAAVRVLVGLCGNDCDYNYNVVGDHDDGDDDEDEDNIDNSGKDNTTK